MEDSYENIKYRSCGFAFRGSTSRNEFDYSGANAPWFIGCKWQRGAGARYSGIDEFERDALGEPAFSFDQHTREVEHA